MLRKELSDKVRSTSPRRVRNKRDEIDNKKSLSPDNLGEKLPKACFPSSSTIVVQMSIKRSSEMIWFSGIDMDHM